MSDRASFPVPDLDLLRRPALQRPVRASLYRYQLPLRRPLMLSGTRVTTRHGLLIELLANDGLCGWGDVVPLPGFDVHDIDQCQVALEGLLSAADGQVLPAPARWGLESAIDALARPEPIAAIVAVNALVDTGPLEPQLARLAVVRPAVVKVKIAAGNVGARAIAGRVTAVAEALPLARLRIDANRSLTLAAGETLAAQLPAAVRARVEYVEEPCNASDTARFNGATGLPVGLDETVASALRRAGSAEAWAADLAAVPGLAAVVVKPALLGFARPVKTLARHLTCPVVVSDTYQSGVGVSALVRLAAGLPPVACGLDTYHALYHDVLTTPLEIGVTVEVQPALAAGQRVRRELITQVATFELK